MNEPAKTPATRIIWIIWCLLWVLIWLWLSAASLSSAYDCQDLGTYAACSPADDTIAAFATFVLAACSGGAILLPVGKGKS